MNVAKFLVTVLLTALYTSAWWSLAFLLPYDFLTKSPTPFSIITFLTLVFGTVGILIGAISWFGLNWNKE
jgi:hypothetical protein